ncbi:MULTISPECIES: ScbR family autoregulator-binding transcription factor [Streptomyces]|uniref:ScbR family autoregulator-binding transcription factor n=1 Tax=Streptomyces TaxID=1883 RepID=UPI00166FEE22|nr:MULTISPECIES: ScbR family autoregulator-binding transcription factor [Streptomyces]UFR05200.1 TetR/AcrR family transcriptional regulator [Streptomyces sp. Go40/10]
MAVREVKQERAARTRAALIRAAAEVFAESGFAGASVSRIAERAGLTLGAVYFHFKSKEELAREIVTSQPDLVVPPQDSHGLQHAIDVTLTWAYQLLDDPVLQAGARLVMDQEHFVPKSENSHQQWMSILLRDFRDAQVRRELRLGVDVEAYARLVVSACTGAQMQAQLETSRSDLPYRVEEVWRCLLPAVAVPSAAKKMQFGRERGVAE